MPKRTGTTPWKFTIWGSRGSVPTSSPGVREFGGQTTCHEIDLPGARIIVDAGSGMVELARHCPTPLKETLLLFTHVHWDHVVGFPFYSPLFQGGWDLHVRGVPRCGKGVYQTMCDLNQPPIFPIMLGERIRANVIADDLAPTGSATFHGIDVAWLEVTHPGGCTAFSFSNGEERIVFTGDVEIPHTDRAALVAFCADVDVLICDAQYTPEEYANHVGWGHSTNIHAAELARDAGAKRLILTHHDPTHDDAKIHAMVAQARTVFANVDGARHRMVVSQHEAS